MWKGPEYGVPFTYPTLGLVLPTQSITSTSLFGSTNLPVDKNSLIGINLRFTLNEAPNPPPLLEIFTFGIFVYPYPVSITLNPTICPNWFVSISNTPPSPSSMVIVSPSE